MSKERPYNNMLFWIKELAFKRRFSLWVMAVSLLLIIIIRPPITTLGFSVLLGAVSGGIQLLGAYWHTRLMYDITNYIMIIIIIAMIYLGIKPFRVTLWQTMACVSSFIATRDIMIGYLHWIAFNGTSFSFIIKDDK